MAKIDFEVQSLDKVKTLIDILDKNKKLLPDDVLNSLFALADCKACEYGIGAATIPGVQYHHVSCFFDGEEVKGVVSVNMILKRVTVYPDRFDGEEHPELKGGGFISAHKYPESFEMRDKESNLVMGW